MSVAAVCTALVGPRVVLVVVDMDSCRDKVVEVVVVGTVVF